MLFNSFSFLIFFPVVTLIYFAIPHRVRYLWLLAASYYFYMSWNAKYALLLLFSTSVTYLSGLLIGAGERIENKNASRRFKKTALILSFTLNLSVLFFFKYFDFALDNLNLILGALGIRLLDPAFDVLLPVGISFFTFQALSYTMDVYRKDIPVETNFFRYALFVSFFPQLVAGPIERSTNLLPQLSRRHRFDYQRAKEGLLLMIWGLFLKLVISDRVAIIVNQVYGNYTAYGGFGAAFATLMFGLQIYCDFGAYSLIAKGAARVMGFSLMDNFRQPYFSKSVAEFWRRWHISLSSWFRDYLYIPLGGNRKGKGRKYLNTLIVFFTSGLWHGASWTFVIWGGLHGIFIVLGDILRPAKAFLTDRLHISRAGIPYGLLQILITFLLVNFAWIFFRAESLDQAFGIIDQIFCHMHLSALTDGTVFTLGLDARELLIGLAALAALFVVSLLRYRDVPLDKIITRSGLLIQWPIYLLLIFVTLIFGIYGPLYSASQFIYFQF